MTLSTFIENLVCPSGLIVETHYSNNKRCVKVYSPESPSITLSFPTPQKAQDWLADFTTFPVTWRLQSKALREPSRFSLSLDDNL